MHKFVTKIVLQQNSLNSYVQVYSCLEGVLGSWDGIFDNGVVCLVSRILECVTNISRGYC